MDKGLLFQFMRVKFREAGFTPAETELHMQSFVERYENKSDEEIEADIRRRGGPTRVAAATIERRNTVLMADSDYRAFVESAKVRETAPAAEAPAAEAAADTSGKADAVSSETEDTPWSEPILPAQTHGETHAETDAHTADEDPLAAWFAASEKEDTEDSLPPLFSGAQTKTASASAAEDSDASLTAEIPVGKPAAQTAQTAQTVHSIPLFGGETAQQAQTAKPAEPRTDSPAAGINAGSPVGGPRRMPGGAQPPRPGSQGGMPKPSADAAHGQTRIVPIPTEQRNAPVQQKTAGASAIDDGRTRQINQYQDEQRAIWGTSQEIRDPRGGVQNPRASHPVPRSDARAAKQTEKEQKIEYVDRGNVTRLQEMTYWGEGSEEGVKRFRIVMAIAIPIMTVLLLAYAVIALGLIVFMAVLMAAFILGLVAEVAIGSLIALVAVIYGISQLFIVMPIGMFELGLGVAAIGITMFVGILMYNIAVRLLPFLMRQFIRFQGVFKGFLQDLYYYVKGECYRR